MIVFIIVNTEVQRYRVFYLMYFNGSTYNLSGQFIIFPIFLISQ